MPKALNVKAVLFSLAHAGLKPDDPVIQRAHSLDVRLKEEAGHKLNHLEFLEPILQDELLVRQQRQIDRRVKAADFRELKPLDDFVFAFES